MRRRKFELISISMDGPDQREPALETLKQNKVAARNFIYTGGDRDKLLQSLTRSGLTAAARLHRR